MHTLMSFVGSVGALMGNSGLDEVLKAAFGGVTRMLTGKNFPQNTETLRMVAEELSSQSFQEQKVTKILWPFWRRNLQRAGR